MIVDTHTHLWHNLDQLGPQISAQLRERSADAWDQFDAGTQAHEAAMAPVAAAFVLGFRSVYLGADVPNSMISDYVASQPARLIGFAGIDPLADDYLDEVAEAPSRHLRGVVISPAEQGYHPCDSRAMRLYELCQRMNLPVFIHQGGHLARDSMMEYAQPYLLDEVARSFPQLRLILSHCGHPWTEQALVLVGKHRHFYTTLSGVVSRPWQLYNVLLQAVQFGVTDRLLMGSNFPRLLPQQAIEAIYSLNRFTQGTGLTSVPREKLRSIVERDALECVGLKTAGGHAEKAAVPEPRPVQAAARTPQGETA